MTKPTFLQRLFNAPSQSYAFPVQEKNYHSTKATLLKVARQDDTVPKLPHSIASIFPKDRSASTPSPLTLVEDTESEVTSEEEFHTPDSASNPILSATAEGDQSFPSSSASSTDSVADDSDSETIEASVFSSHSASTHATTPTPSDSGRSKSPSLVPSITTTTAITISSTSKPSSRTSSVDTQQHATYTDEDWAKEVRWLVPPPASNSSSTKKSKRSRGPTIAQRADHRPLPESKQESLRKAPKGKTRMSAVLEMPEDEDDYQSSQNSRTSKITYKRTRPSLDGSAERSWAVHHLASKSTPSLTSVSDRYQTVTVPSTSHIHCEPGTSSRGTAPYNSMTLPRANLLPPAHSTYSASASPRNGLLLNGGAGVLQKLKIEDVHKVDLSRGGLAGTTMATIEIVKGTAEVVNRPGGLTRSFSQRLSTRLKSRGKSGRPPGYLAREMPTPLGFCSHIPPPTHVPPHHVLVQVWAVGLDGRDAAIVLKDKQNTPGFVPGRSFVGRVVEVGWEVRADTVKKGEWVIGLMEVKKSGALAEFITLDRHRIHRVPGPAPIPTLGTLLSNSRPPSRAPSPSPSVRSTRSATSRTSKTGLNSVLTVEELALLPICGVFAYRAVKTFDPSTLNPAIPAPRKSRPRRILILNGHSGVGALSAQLLIRRGWKVITHVSPEAVSNGGSALHSSLAFKNIERRLRRWGVEDVCLGEATAVITMLGERCKTQPGGYAIDGVLDTIGGLDIWNAALQHILSNSSKPPNPESDPMGDDSMPPQFTTLVGDDRERTIPSAQDHFKAGFRSMKRAMNAACGYAWISVAADIDGEGLDVRDALAGIIRWVEETRGQVKPYVENQESPLSTPVEVGTERGSAGSVGRVVLFENAPHVFAEGAKSLTCGGNVVVKVVS